MKIVGLVLIALLASPAWSQPAFTQPPAVDPTENVKALSEAANKRQDDLRDSEDKYQNAMREAAARRFNDLRAADTQRINELRDAETRRINELAAQKQIFDLELARVIRANVDSSTLLLATQLKEVKNDLSDRTAKLEQFRWESGGLGTGRSDVIGWMIAALMFLIALAGPIITIMTMRSRPVRH